MPFQSDDLIFGLVVGFLLSDTMALREKSSRNWNNPLRRKSRAKSPKLFGRLLGNYRAEHYWLEAYPT